jgi:hypothetical protein
MRREGRSAPALRRFLSARMLAIAAARLALADAQRRQLPSPVLR